MSLSTRYGFADAPTSAIIGNGSLAWTTSTGALAAAGTSLTVLASVAFPAALEFDVIIGVRDPTTNAWASAEIRHVTVVSGTTWTVSAGSLDHVSGSDISHVLTATGLTHNPGALTDTGDLPYLLSTGRMGRLGAPANGIYSLTWASGVPSWTAAASPGITFPDLAAPPTNTALGASGTPFGAAFLGTTAIGQGSANLVTLSGAAAGHFPQIATSGSDTEVSLWINSQTGTANHSAVIISNIDPSTWAAGLQHTTAGVLETLADCTLNCPDWVNTGIATTPIFYGRYANGTVTTPLPIVSGDLLVAVNGVGWTAAGWTLAADFDLIATADAAPGAIAGAWRLMLDDGTNGFPAIEAMRVGPATATFIGTVTATDFIVSGSRFKSDTVDTHTGGLAVYDVNGAAYRDFLVWTNANAPAVVLSIPTTGTLSIDASTLTLNSVAVATQTYVNAQGFVTAGAVVTYVTGLGYTTLADVAGVGYVPGTRTVNGHALSSNVTVTASDLSLGSVENAAASGLYVPLTRTVNGHALSGNINVTASDLSLGSVENAAASGLYVPLTRTVNGHALSGNITVTASDLSLGSVENTALSTWAGSTNLTTLGTIATGTWSGTTIAANKGGTGQTVYVVGDLLQASTTTALSTLAAVATGSVVISGGIGTVSAWGKVGLTTHVSGILPTANGGTGIAFFTAAGPTQARIYTFPDAAATIARTDAANTFTGVQTMTSPAITGPVTLTEVVGSSGLTLTGATQVTSFPALSITQTWNAGGVVFTGIKANITNTASAAGSLLLDLQVAAGTVCKVDKSGVLTLTGPSSTPAILGGNSPFRTGALSLGFNFSSGGGVAFCTDAAGGTTVAGAHGNGFSVSSASGYSWTSSTLGAAPDTFLMRGGAAAVVQHGQDVNGAAVNQIIATANGITGQNKTGGNLTIASGKGTDLGAVSSLILQTPTVGGATNGTAQALATRLTIDSSGLTIADAMNLIVNATTGTKIGTATSQKLGFWNATPIIQPVGAGQAAYTDSTGGVAAASLVDVTTAAVSDPVKVNANFATVSVLLLAMRTALLNTGLMKGAA